MSFGFGVKAAANEILVTINSDGGGSFQIRFRPCEKPVDPGEFLIEQRGMAFFLSHGSRVCYLRDPHASWWMGDTIE